MDGICKDCKHWIQQGEAHGILYGECVNPDLKATVIQSAGASGEGGLLTDEDWGCNQFEERGV